MTGAIELAKDRRGRCRELGRVDQSSAKTKEELEALEFLGAAGEMAFALAFNLNTDWGIRSGGADFILPKKKTVDVKTVSTSWGNLLVKESAAHYDGYVLVENIGYIWDGRFVLRGWASGKEVRATPVGERFANCHFLYRRELHDFKNSNCKNFLEGVNRSELPAARRSNPPLPPFVPHLSLLSA
jgi:hypothetical protein